jgi:osmotically-inducible protein OsmY
MRLWSSAARHAAGCGHWFTPAEGSGMRTASELQRDVLDEMNWQPGLPAGGIGVSAHGGVVTLTGHVQSFAQKTEAEKVAKRVYGVRGVANDLVVQLHSSHERDDTAIAEAAVKALKWHTGVPEDRVQVTVRNGWLTLEGEVDSYHQKANALRAVHDLIGVIGVSTLITITATATAPQVKEKIEAAFRRSAAVDAKAVKVEAIGNRVVLRGTVTSWKEYEAAENAAWSAPGITTVDNLLAVEGEALLGV